MNRSINKVGIMKKKKMKLIMSLSVIIIGFLISTSLLNTFSTQAIIDTNENQYNIDSFDRFAWKWSTTEVISTESTDDSYYPSLAIDAKGNVHIAWEDLTDYAGAGIGLDIFYKRWDATTSAWTTTEVVSTESAIPHSYHPSLAVDAAGNVHIAWEDLTNYAGSGTDHDIFYKNWEVSTALWTFTEVVSTESIDDSYYPALAADSAGNVYITWWDQTDYVGAGTDIDIFYKRWDATISAWTTTEVVSTESTGDSVYPSITIDAAGNVHITWSDGTDYLSSGTDEDIFYKRWDATTSAWTTIEVVSTESTGGSYSPSLAVDTLGNVHITWWDQTDYVGAGTDVDIFYKRWDAFIFTWTTTEVVSTESTGGSIRPSIAIDAAGNVHIAWQDNTDYAGSGLDTDIFYEQFAGSPTAPELAFIVPNPTELTSIYLDWNSVFVATSYHVYRSTSYIWSVEGLVPITTISSSDYIDTLPSEGFYYYVIVAENFVGNSSHSNCEYTEYKLPTLYEFVIISSLIIGIPVFLLLVARIRKKNTKQN